MTEESSTTYSSSLGVRREDSFSSDCGGEGSVITEGDSYSDSDTDVDTATDAIVQHSNARLEAQLRKTLAANRLQRNENECMESSIANALLEKHAPLIQKCSALEAQKISLQLGHTALLERVMRAGREIEAAHKRAHEQKRAIEASRYRQQQELNCLVAVG
jgi:hypothetical protein